MLRLAYSALFTLALPLVLMRLWWRGRNEAGYRAHIGERFGRFAQVPVPGAIWVHAVSVGEVRAALPLVRALQVRYAAAPILLTCMTPSGRAMAATLFGAQSDVTIAYLPYDLSWLMRRLLRHFKPRALLIMETEIWFNLVHACREARLPVLLVNARLSARSRAAYARSAPIRKLAVDALASMSLIAAQSADDAARFESLGAQRVVVTGNIKFDMPVDAAIAGRGAVWRAELAGSRQVLLLAATRDGEETLLLDAFRAAFDTNARRHILLVVVPRHSQRFDEVVVQVSAAGFQVARRSALGCRLDNVEVWVGDSMGEMAAYYTLCDLAIIGGSFAPLGGQNLIEAAALGRPTIIGPHVFNFSDAVRLAAAAGALLQVSDAGSAMRAARDLLADQATMLRMSAAAQAFSEAHRGATDKTIELIAAAIGPH